MKTLLPLLLLVSWVAYAEPVPPLPDKAIPEPTTVEVDFPESIGLSDYVATMARRLGKNIIMDPNVSGKLQIVAQDNLSPEDAYQVFTSALNYLGYTTVETGALIKVVRIAEGQKKENPLIKEQAKLGKTDQVVTYVLPLEHLSPQVLLPALNQLVTTQSVTIAPTSNSLIICDSSINVARLVKVVKLLDAKSDHEKIEVFKVNNASAESLLAKLKELLKPLPGQAARSKAQLSMVADTLSNSLLFFGSSVDIAHAIDIAKQIDGLPASNGRGKNLYVRPIEFAEAKKLASVLQSLTIIAKSAATSEARKSNSDGQKIFVDVDTNSLLIKGSRRYYQAVDSLIRQLDKRRPMVFFSVDIMEISTNHTLTLGTAYAYGDSSQDKPGEGLRWLNTWQFTNAPVLIPPAPGARSEQTAAQMASSISEGVTVAGFGNEGVNIPGMGVVSPRGLIQLIKTDGDTKSLSSPQLLTLDNEEAMITVGETLFFKTQIKDRVGTKSDSLSKENVDLQLTLKGKIAGEDYINLDFTLDAQALESITANGLPLLARQKIKQKVNVRNQQTMVLVGVSRQIEGKSFSKVPLLGDIPLLGVLFRKENSQTKLGQLAIFLTPYIIRKTSDLAKINQKFLQLSKEQLPLVSGGATNGNNFLAD